MYVDWLMVRESSIEKLKLCDLLFCKIYDKKRFFDWKVWFL